MIFEKKFPYWNWLKIGIWDPKALCSNAMHLVSLDPADPYHKFIKTRSASDRSILPWLAAASVASLLMIFSSSIFPPTPRRSSQLGGFQIWCSQIFGFFLPPSPFVPILCTVCPQNGGIFNPPSVRTSYMEAPYSSPFFSLALSFLILWRRRGRCLPLNRQSQSRIPMVPQNDWIRGHPYMTYAKFSGFWTPSPLLYAFHATYQSYCTQKLVISLTPPPPRRVRT